jgi:hypothetical protein
MRPDEPKITLSLNFPHHPEVLAALQATLATLPEGFGPAAGAPSNHRFELSEPAPTWDQMRRIAASMTAPKQQSRVTRRTSVAMNVTAGEQSDSDAELDYSEDDPASNSNEIWAAT